MLTDEERLDWLRLIRSENVGPITFRQLLARLGEAALTSVGAYHVEGLGAQLFTRIEGDYFSILGLPLLPLLDFLRVHGVLDT